jgi:lipoyl(octanoyl) transferase
MQLQATEARTGARPCRLETPGRVPYGEALRLQRELSRRRLAGEIPDVLLLLEHPHVVTLGRNASRENLIATPELLEQRGVEVHATDRGGDVTYHGPGQLVGYPVLDLRPDRMDIVRYVHDVEEVLIRTLGDFGIEARRREGRRGVWVEDAKIAAVGIRISRWITSHGFALNVSTDLDYFDLIVPCGLRGCPVTSMERVLGRPVAPEGVLETLPDRFGEVFERKMVVSRA